MGLRKWIFIFGIAVTLLFVFLSAYCMVIYPGGTISDPNSEGYSFFTNYFSDLGRTHNFLKKSNLISMLIFRSSVTLVGIAAILFYMVIPHFFTTSPLCRNLSIIGSLTGIITGLGYIGIGFTPIDIMHSFHMMMVKLSFNSFLITVIIYAVAIYKNPIYSNLYAWVYSGFGIMLSLYMLINIFGPDHSSTYGLSIHVISQKVIVYAQIICMMIQANGAWVINKATALGSKQRN